MASKRAQKQPTKGPGQQRLVNDIFLQPWFVPRETAHAIRRLLTDAYFRKMRCYFDDWGCLACGESGLLYESNGMCCRCVQRIQKRLFWSLQKRGTVSLSSRTEPSSLAPVKLARILLGDLVVWGDPAQSHSDRRQRQPKDAL
jgi:hypothetical protein